MTSTATTYVVTTANGADVEVKAAAVETADHLLTFLDGSGNTVAAFRGFTSFYPKGA